MNSVDAGCTSWLLTKDFAKKTQKLTVSQRKARQLQTYMMNIPVQLLARPLLLAIVQRCDLSKVGVPGVPVGMNEKIVTITVLLKEQGYAAGQFGSNHSGDLKSIVTM